MARSITADEQTIIELFAKTNQYIIPSYQRPYSWGDKECTELWEDLVFAFESEDNEYFLGNIVLAHSKERVEKEVIDGQQRLITLTIMLKVLNLLQEHRDLEEAILHTDRDTEKQSPRVITRVYENKDDENFKTLLDYTQEKIESINLKNANQFEENFYFFYEKIKEFSDDKLRKFRNFLFDNIYLLAIESVDLKEDKAREKALVIFETINNRGLDLSDADIFKSQLYNSALNQQKHEDFEKKWTSLVELVKDNQYELDDIFRIYTHVLRGKNKETGSEIGLRAFFSQENDKYQPLRKQNYNNVLNDLFKIVLIVDIFNRCIKNQYPENNSYSQLTKWFQIVREYSNNYPRFVIFVYLFYNSKIDEYKNLIIEEKQIEKLILLSQNIIRYSYPHTSSMKIKFDIFKIIEKIANGEEYSFADKIEKMQKKDFTSLKARDLRKNGLTLLAIYLDKKQNPINPYYIHTIITNQNQKNLNTTWDSDKIASLSNSIGNLLLTDIKRKTQALNQRANEYKESKVIDLQELSTKLDDFSYDDFQAREELLSQRLADFFASDKLW
ncbi:MAG: hypothetical protein KU38_09960 [Sulfurovum sp. FS08-3]|nr:MAG: hypothetical protein KU38_09960 [Sulfurovum sp. FS08-3]